LAGENNTKREVIMPLDLSCPEIQLAVGVVRRAAQLAQRVQSGMALMNLTKSDFSPATVADYAIQAVVARSLRDVFPEDILVGEEHATDLRKPEAEAMRDVVFNFVKRGYPDVTLDEALELIDRGGTAPTSGRFWVLDPVDGTKGYLRGGQYAVALALIEDGVVKLGVLGCPNLGEGCLPDICGAGALVVAAKGQGAWYTPLNEQGDFRQLSASPCADVTRARILRSLVSEHTNAEQITELMTSLGITPEAMQMDSQAKYAVLAAGEGEVLLRLLSQKQPDYRERIWDQAAGSIVVEEAGGRVTDLDGKPLDFSTGRALENNRGLLVTNGPLHDTLLEGLRSTGA
jgi:3'(2'), 5'-bisphosphate nucleotidase